MIFSGSRADGSDAREFKGVYTNPDNPDEWSISPYTKEDIDFEKQEDREHKQYMRVYDYMSDNSLTLEDVRTQIVCKVCRLSFTDRQYVMEH